MNDAAHDHAPMTVKEYLAFADARPNQRFELLAGAPVAMAPATFNHERICANIDRGLAPQLITRGCDSIRDGGVALSDDATFLLQPDVMVRCGPLDGKKRWTNDPIAVFEVLSPSTMADDRGYKLKQYLRLSSLRHLVLVYQDETRVEHWSRDPNGEWSEEPSVLKSGADAIDLNALDARLSLGEVYRGVTSA